MVRRPTALLPAPPRGKGGGDVGRDLVAEVVGLVGALGRGRVDEGAVVGQPDQDCEGAASRTTQARWLRSMLRSAELRTSSGG